MDFLRFLTIVQLQQIEVMEFELKLQEAGVACGFQAHRRPNRQQQQPAESPSRRQGARVTCGFSPAPVGVFPAVSTVALLQACNWLGAGATGRERVDLLRCHRHSVLAEPRSELYSMYCKACSYK